MTDVTSSSPPIGRPWRFIPVWLTGSWGRVGIASVVYSLVFMAWSSFHWGGPENIGFIGNLTVLPLGLLAVLTAWRVAAQRPLAPRLRRAWFLLGLGFLLSLGGDAIWVYLQNILRVDPFPSLADPFYLGFYPLVLCGLLSLPDQPRQARDHYTLWLDLLAIMIAATMFVAHFILLPIASAGDGDALTQAVAVAYPIGALSLLGGTVVVLYRRPDPDTRAALLFLVLGMASYLISDLTYSYTSLIGTYAAGGWIDVGWVIAQLFTILAALRQLYRSPTQVRVPRWIDWLDRLSWGLSMMATTLGFALVAYVALTDFDSSAIWLLCGALLLSALVAGRRIFAPDRTGASLRVRLILAFVVTSTLSVGLMTITGYLTVSTNLEAAAGANLKAQVQVRAQAIASLFDEYTEALRNPMLSRVLRDKAIGATSQYAGGSVAVRAQLQQREREWKSAVDGDPLVQAVLGNAVAADLRELRAAFPNYETLLLTDQYGATLAATDRPTHYLHATQAWWQAAYNQGELFVGQPQLDPGTYAVRVVIAVPVRSRDGHSVVGVLRATYNLRDIVAMLRTSHPEQMGDYSLLLPTGQALTARGDIVPVDPAALARLQAPASADYAMTRFEDLPQVVALAPVTAPGREDALIFQTLKWTLFVHQPSAEFLAPVNATGQAALLAALVVLALTTAGGVFVARRLVSPLARLTAVAGRIAGGDFSARAPIESDDEIGTFANTFNTMLEALGRAQQAVQASEECYRAVIEDQTEFISRFTPDGVVTFANSAYARHMGLKPQQLIGQNLLSSLSEEERSTVQQRIRSFTPEDPTMIYARETSLPDGTRHYEEWTARALFDGAGQMVECQAVGRDITQRKQAEQAVRLSEARYRLVVENALESIIVIQDRVCKYANPRAEQIAGFSAEELASIPFTELIHPDDRQMVLERHLRRLAGAGESAVYPFRIVDKAGDVKWVEVRATVVDWQGRPATLNLLSDVTENKRAEAALSKSERFLHNIIENIPDMIFVKDAEALRFVLFNKAGKELLGLSTEQLLGKSDFDIVPASIAEQYVAKDREVLRNKQFLDIPEEPIQTHDQGARVLHTKKIPILNEAGEPLYLLGISEDITERKQAEEQIRQQLATLTALYAGAQNLATSLDSLKLAQDVALTCVEKSGVTLALIGRALPDGRVHRLAQFPQEMYYPRELKVRWDDTPEGRGSVGQAIRSGTPVITGDITADPRFGDWKAAAERYGIACGAVFPLISRDSTMGALMLYSNQPGYFTPERVQFFQSYALLAAAALENARLFEEAERRLSNVQALHRIDVAITSSLDLNLTLDIILNQVTTQLHADAAAILLFDRRSRVLSYAAGRGFRTRAVQDTHLGLGEGYAGRAVLERRTVMGETTQATGYDIPNQHYRALVSAEGFVTHVDTPLIAKGQVVGVLGLFHRAALSTDSEWLAFLETLATQAAIAIDSATLFDGLQRSNAELELAYDSTLEGWGRALDLRDRETEGHTQRVTEITMRLARVMSLSDAVLVHVYRGALLHDIGKMGIPDSILLKPGPLTDEEWVIMRKHPQYAYEMLYPIKYLRPALDIPYCHHEKWDGMGYPRGLKGEEIPLAARIFAVADVWDALTSDRPYHVAWPEEQVRDHIRSLAGTHFDPQVVEAFLKLEVWK